jgi:hypothetical protein
LSFHCFQNPTVLHAIQPLIICHICDIMHMSYSSINTQGEHNIPSHEVNDSQTTHHFPIVVIITRQGLQWANCVLQNLDEIKSSILFCIFILCILMRVVGVEDLAELTFSSWFVLIKLQIFSIPPCWPINCLLLETKYWDCWRYSKLILDWSAGF